MPERYTKADIAKLAGRSFIFDANVLIYIFWPSSPSKERENYSSLIASLIVHKYPLYLDNMIISEFYNRCFRLEFETYQSGISQPSRSQSEFKKFRNSALGKTTDEDISNIIINNLLKVFKVIGKSFDDAGIKKLFPFYPLDYTDRLLVELCREESLILVTHDADFRDSDISILSQNPNLK